MIERGRSTYYRMLHFIVGEASPLCPSRPEETRVKSLFRVTECAFRISEWPFRVTECTFRDTERRLQTAATSSTPVLITIFMHEGKAGTLRLLWLP